MPWEMSVEVLTENEEARTESLCLSPRHSWGTDNPLAIEVSRYPAFCYKKRNVATMSGKTHEKEEVGAFRESVPCSEAVESIGEDRSPLRVLRALRLNESALCRLFQTSSHGLLHRRIAAEHNTSGSRKRRLDYPGRGYQPTDTPARGAEHLW